MNLQEYIIAEGADVEGINYRVTIYRDGWMGSVRNMLLSGDIARITYSPKTSDYSSAIVASRADLFFRMRGVDDYEWLKDIFDVQNTRYFVKIEQDKTLVKDWEYYDARFYKGNILENGGEVIGQDCLDDFVNKLKHVSSDENNLVDYQPYWRGIVLQETSERPDKEDLGSVYLVRCTDGIGITKLSDPLSPTFNIETTDGELGFSFRSYTQELLASILPIELWGENERFASFTSYWWDNGQNYSTIGDPFTDIVMTNDSKESLGKDLLQQIEIMSASHAMRLYMADGMWVWEQISVGHEALNKRNIYNPSGAALYSGVSPWSQTIDQTRQAAKLRGGKYIAETAVKSVQIILYPTGSFAWENYEYVLNQTECTSTDEYRVGSLRGEGRVKVGVDFSDMRVDLYVQRSFLYPQAGVLFPNGGTVLMRPVVVMQITFEDLTTGATYYASNTGWTLNPNSVVNMIGDVKLGSFGSFPSSDPVVRFTYQGNAAGNTGDPTVMFITEPLPTSAGVLKWKKVKVGLEWKRIYMDWRFVCGPYNASATDSLLGWRNAGAVQVSTIDNDQYYLAENANPNVRNGAVVRSVYGRQDEGAAIGVFRYDPTAPVFQTTGNWKRKNSGAALNLAGLLAQELLSLKSNLTEKYNGQILTSKGYLYKPQFDDGYWLPMNVTYNLGRGSMNGSWEQVVSGNLDGNLTLPDLIGSDLSSAQTLKISQGDTVTTSGDDVFGGGYIGRMYRDSNNVLTNPDVFYLESAVANRTEVIEATGGGGGSVSNSATVVLITWVGATGVYNLEIPDPSVLDGRLLEIILDNSFEGSGTTDVIIAANGGANIQGAASITLSNDLERVLLRAINGNWW